MNSNRKRRIALAVAPLAILLVLALRHGRIPALAENYHFLVYMGIMAVLYVLFRRTDRGDRTPVESAGIRRRPKPGTILWTLAYYAVLVLLARFVLWDWLGIRDFFWVSVVLACGWFAHLAFLMVRRGPVADR